MNKHSSQSIYKIYKTLPALLILFLIYTTAMPETARAQNPQPPGIEVTTQNNFGEKFRAGRDAIDRQEWARAIEQFREAVEKHPDHKLADAALYWLAFCYKKQKKFEEADAALDRLFKEFPASPWTGDAQVMKTEILPFLRNVYDDSFNANKNFNPAQGQFSSDLQAQIINKNVNNSGQNSSLAEKLAMNDRLPLDRADEIRIAAFQSLSTADPRRAIETMGEILKPDSNASENLKLSILRVWRNPRLFAAPPATANAAQNAAARELASFLRETLAKSFQNEKNLRVRIEIIYRLATFADVESLDYLKRFYAAENEPDIKKEIINSLSVTASVYETLKPAQKQSADVYAAREELPKARLDFLLEILRTERDANLRRQALETLRRLQERSLDAPTVDALARAYDSEADEDFKISLVRIFANAKQTAAIKKLLDIAKNDRSDKLRLEAIYGLRNSKDPEVVKFLQDLIK